MNYLKTLFLALILTLLAIVFQHSLHFFLNLLGHFHAVLQHQLHDLFSNRPFALWSVQILAFIMTPFCIAFFIDLVLRLVVRSYNRSFSFCFWLVWILLVAIVFK